MNLLLAALIGYGSSVAAATVDTLVGGTLSNSDNGCINIIPLLGGQDCSYAQTRYPAPGGWQGPIFSASYYQLGFFASNSADGFAPSVGDAKVNMPLSGTFTVDDNGTPADGTDDRISGTFSVGAADHWVSTGNGDQALERWSSWNHTLAPTTVNFATAQPGGGFEYVIGVRGKPTPAPLSLAADPTEVFSSEAAPAALTANPWNTSGASQALRNRIGIERSVGYGNFNNTGTDLRPNAGATTTATLDNYQCFDSDNDCTTSNIMIGTSLVPGTVVTLPPGFSNLVLIVTTGADGRITTGEGYWTREYIITAGPPIGNDPPGTPTTNNSWTGGRFTFKGCSITGPVAVADTFSVDEGTTDNVLSVLANDTLSCTEPNTISIVTQPAHGTATVNPAGDGILYTPERTGNVYYAGPDSLGYIITDGNSVATANATVDITVEEVVPTAQNCTGASSQGNPASCTVITSETIGSGTILENTIVLGGGTLGTCTAAGQNLVFTPTLGGGNGIGGCSYQIQDADGDLSNTAQFMVTVTNNGQGALDDQAFTKVDTPVVIDVLDNDVGFDDPVTLGLFLTPSHGSVSIVGSPGPRYGIALTYSPSPGFHGQDQFQYAIDDGGQAYVATVTVNVVVDSDGDGVFELQDNCSLIANPDQRDTDGDGYGNRCDADLDQNGFVNYADLSIFRSRFGGTDSNADLDGNGFVNFADLSILRSLFGKPPGPSGLPR